jgi:hypothetical protein
MSAMGSWSDLLKEFGKPAYEWLRKKWPGWSPMTRIAVVVAVALTTWAVMLFWPKIRTWFPGDEHASTVGTNNGLQINGTINGPVTVNAPAPSRSTHVEFEKLRPGRETTPPNGCSGPDYESDSGPPLFRVLFGQTAFAQSGYGTWVPLWVGSCPVVSVERTPDSVNATVDLYDSEGNLIAHLQDNVLESFHGKGFRAERSGLNAISVRDERDREWLNLRYVNPTTLSVRGLFGCAGHPMVAVDGDGIHNAGGGIVWGRACISLGGGIHVN